MARVRVTRRLLFSAGHRLFRADLGEEENQRIFGDCGNPGGHGHNYELDVSVEGEVDPETGFVLDMRRLRDLVHDRVVRDVDHANLNADVEWMRDVIPTCENLAVRIWRRLEGALDGATLVSVRVRETPHNSVEYRGE